MTIKKKSNTFLGTNMNVYIAGPFSHSEEKQALLRMIELVKKRFPTANFYIPMEYKVPGNFQKLDGTWNLPNFEWARKVYEADVTHLNTATMVFALYTAHYCFSGTIWEIGYAKGRNIPVIGYLPTITKGQDVSLMVMNGFDGYIDEEGIIKKFTNDDLNNYNQK